jgi:gluconokinase
VDQRIESTRTITINLGTEGAGYRHREDPASFMIIVLMGPTASGKSTLGRALADALRWPFHDADDLHPPANVDKMRRGIPLGDADRAPWLARVRALMADVSARRGDAIVACSALRQRYRTMLAEGLPAIRFVMLASDRTLLEARLASRRHHFAGATLLDSQLQDLEVPPDALILQAADPVEALVDQVCAAFSLPCGDAPRERR